MVILTSKFLPTNSFKWVNLKEFYLDKYASISSKGCVLKADVDYPKKVKELYNNYPLAPDKIEIKRKILLIYPLKIVDFCNIPNANVKKLVRNFFHKETYVLHYENLQFYLRLEFKLKKIHHILELKQCLKPYVEYNTKKNRRRKIW